MRAARVVLALATGIVVVAAVQAIRPAFWSGLVAGLAIGTAAAVIVMVRR